MLLLLLPIYSFAIIPTDSILSSTVVTTLSNNDVCNLPGPSNLHVTSTTPTSISVAWNPVPGVFGYRVVATAIWSGSTLYYGTTNGTTAMITAPPGTSVQIAVYSLCSVDDPGGFSSIVGQTDLIILQDIVATYTGSPEPQPVCETFSFNEIVNLFQVRHNINAGIFKNFHIRTNPLPSGVNTVEVGYINLDFSEMPGPDQGSGLWRFTNEKLAFPQNGGSVTAKQFVTIRYAGSGNFIPVLQLTITLVNNGYTVCWAGLQSNYVLKELLPNELKTDPNPTSFAQLSPNPFTDALTLYLEDPAPERSILRIFDLSGRGVLKQDIEPFVTSATVDFEPTLQPGIYMARFESPEGVHMFKIIKTE